MFYLLSFLLSFNVHGAEGGSSFDRCHSFSSLSGIPIKYGPSGETVVDESLPSFRSKDLSRPQAHKVEFEVPDIDSPGGFFEVDPKKIKMVRQKMTISRSNGRPTSMTIIGSRMRGMAANATQIQYAYNEKGECDIVRSVKFNSRGGMKDIKVIFDAQLCRDIQGLRKRYGLKQTEVMKCGQYMEGLGHVLNMARDRAKKLKVYDGKGRQVTRRAEFAAIAPTAGQLTEVDLKGDEVLAASVQATFCELYRTQGVMGDGESQDVETGFIKAKGKTTE